MALIGVEANLAFRVIRANAENRRCDIAAERDLRKSSGLAVQTRLVPKHTFDTFDAFDAFARPVRGRTRLNCSLTSLTTFAKRLRRHDWKGSGP